MEMSAPVPALFGLVLAGGQSRRFGRDKAGVEVDGQDLLARSVGLLQPVCEQVYVSVRQDQAADTLRSRFPVIIDTCSNIGPAAGLVSAHAKYPDVAWFAIACDLPLLTAGAIGALAEVRRADKGATGYLNPQRGFAEPLCAIWEPATLEMLQQRVAARELCSPRDLLAQVQTELIAAPEARLLENLNTGADYERLGLSAGNRSAARESSLE